MFDSSQYHKVQLPNDPDRIANTYITETNDIFILTQKGENYFMQFIDLDEAFDEKCIEEAY